MNRRVGFVATLLVAGLLAPAPGAGVAHAAAAAAKHYVCTPCNAPCDRLVFDAPGTCPKCGMALVEQGSVAPAPERQKVGILIFDGVEIIDYTGPWEMFGAAGYQVFTVAADKNPVQTAMGMTVVPDHTFADAPRSEVVLVPGGGVRGARDSKPTLEWLRQASGRSELTLSVCNGAFILASAGLLDGLRATTTAHNIAPMRKEFPKVTVVDDARVVDNGRIITAGGLTAGIDGALHVIARMQGQGKAQQVALSEEYDWHPEGGFLRAALADMEIPNVDMDALGEFQVVSTQGSAREWELVIGGTSKLGASELMSRMASDLETKGSWKKAAAPRASTPETASGAWAFVGRDGKPWSSQLAIAPAAGEKNRYTVTLKLAEAR
jgi:putative intracellular protease/amidase